MLPTRADKSAEELLKENAKLRSRLEDLVVQHREALHRLAEADKQNQALQTLFVTAYQLHATLDPVEVVKTLDEILVNLLGAERFCLWGTNGDGEPTELLLVSEGAEGTQALSTGERRLARATFVYGAWYQDPTQSPLPGVEAVAVVPLKVTSSPVGVLVIRAFLDHKPTLNKVDRNVLGLLADQAGAAICSARLHASRGPTT